MSDKANKVKVEHTSRENIENKLLTSLEEGWQVALLVGKKELGIIIRALDESPEVEAHKMSLDFQILYSKAFK